MNTNIKNILREMRGNEFDDPHLDADGIIGARKLARDWADRIEAAVKKQDRAIGKMRSALQEVINAHCSRGGVVNAHLTLDKCLPLLEKCSKAIEASK